jgi:hypothetical protein
MPSDKSERRLGCGKVLVYLAAFVILDLCFFFRDNPTLNVMVHYSQY